MAHVNTTDDAIRTLWGECRNPVYIARKLGIVDELGEPDTERVINAIEDRGNYKRSCNFTTPTKIYTVMNRITHQSFRVVAKTADEACKKCGWLIGYCYVKEVQ